MTDASCRGGAVPHLPWHLVETHVLPLLDDPDVRRAFGVPPRRLDVEKLRSDFAAVETCLARRVRNLVHSDASDLSWVHVPMGGGWFLYRAHSSFREWCGPCRCGCHPTPLWTQEDDWQGPSDGGTYVHTDDDSEDDSDRPDDPDPC